MGGVGLHSTASTHPTHRPAVLCLCTLQRPPTPPPTHPPPRRTLPLHSTASTHPTHRPAVLCLCTLQRPPTPPTHPPTAPPYFASPLQPRLPLTDGGLLGYIRCPHPPTHPSPRRTFASPLYSATHPPTHPPSHPPPRRTLPLHSTASTSPGRERERSITPLQPPKAASGAARTPPGTSQKMKQCASTQRRTSL